MALKPTDIRVLLPVQLILDCHWLVYVRGEGLTDRSIVFCLLSMTEEFQGVDVFFFAIGDLQKHFKFVLWCQSMQDFKVY